MLVGRSRLAADLVALGLRPGAVALVHCRMSALGRVIGGAETVIRALLDTVGPEGTLVAYVGWEDGPVASRCSRLETGSWFSPSSRPTTRPSDARARATAASRKPSAPGPGRCTRDIRRPVSQQSAATPRRLRIRHPLDDAYGPGTPYARVVERGGQVVLLGAPLDTVTLVHHAEAVAHVEGKRRVEWQCPVAVDGEREWRVLHDIDTSAGALPYDGITGGTDYVEYFARVALERGAGTGGPLGAGIGHVLEARALTEITV